MGRVVGLLFGVPGRPCGCVRIRGGLQILVARCGGLPCLFSGRARHPQVPGTGMGRIQGVAQPSGHLGCLHRLAAALPGPASSRRRADFAGGAGAVQEDQTKACDRPLQFCAVMSACGFRVVSG